MALRIAARYATLLQERTPVWAAAAVWLLALAGGVLAVARYEATPGPAAIVKDRAKGLNLAIDRPTLVMFLHPRCPCSNASVTELEEIMHERPGTVRVDVIVYWPSEISQQWSETKLVKRLQQMPNVSVQWDRDGMMAKACNAGTSGQVLVFSPDGKVIFNGGITGSRGHVGENAGAAAVKKILTGTPAAAEAPVFGCAIYSNDGVCQK